MTETPELIVLAKPGVVCVLAMYNCVLVDYVFGTPTVDLAVAMKPEFERFAKNCGGKPYSILCVTSGLGLPTFETQQAFAQHLSPVSNKSQVFALVIEEGGLLASAIRAFASTTFFLGAKLFNLRSPMRSYPTVAKAVFEIYRNEGALIHAALIALVDKARAEAKRTLNASTEAAQAG